MSLSPPVTRRLYPRVTAAALALILALGWMAGVLLGRQAEDEVRRGLDAAGVLLASHVEARTWAAENAAHVLCHLPGFAERLAGGGGAEAARRVDRMLDSFQAGLGAQVVYLMDARGTVVAASNRDRADSFVRMNDAFRPYFRQALAGRTGQYFARGVTSGERGFYASHPITDKDEPGRLAREGHDDPRRHAQYVHPGRVLGAVVVKLGVDEAAEAMRGLPYAFLIDPYGVVFLSSRQEWRFRALWPVMPQAQKALLGSRQFGGVDFRPVLPQEVKDGAMVDLDGERHLVARRPVGQAGWSVLLFGSLRPVAFARLHAVGGTAFLSMLLLGFFLFMQRECVARLKGERQQEELARLAQELQRQATTDALTGVHNRLKLHEVLPYEIERARRYGAPLAAILLDVDHFKQVNDHYGHQAGDRVLVWLAQRIDTHLREADLLFRWGGEEFLVLLPNLDLAAERFRQGIEQGSIEPVCTLTCSFGVAQFRPEDTADSFVQRADEALYRAKSLGRNRVEMESEV